MTTGPSDRASSHPSPKWTTVFSRRSQPTHPWPVVGVIHLPPLLGSPHSRLTLPHIVEQAKAHLAICERAGCEAAIIENFGDVPYCREDVPPVTIASMAAIARDLLSTSSIPLGINVLRNDGPSAVAIAAAIGLAFVRINVLMGAMVTDQGIIQGCAREVALARRNLGWNGFVLADVAVKHAIPFAHLSLDDLARDTYYRAGADGLIVTGTRTGSAPSLEFVRTVRRAVPEAPVLVGSGVDEDNVAQFVASSDGAIVATSLKTDGQLDEEKARRLVARVRDLSSHVGVLE